jgi:hypothetical protein
MGACTRALLKGKINPEEIANFILHYYNLELNQVKTCDIFMDTIKIKEELKPIKQYGDLTDFWKTDCTHIVFINPFNKETHRSLFWCYSNCVFEGEDSDIKSQNETTYISLSYDPEAIAIIKAITTHFGGWMDENDCDGIGYVEVIPNESNGKNDEIKPIFYFTIEELQEHFDGIVKIVSKEEKEKLIEKKITMKKMTPPPPPEAPPLRTLIENFKG